MAPAPKYKVYHGNTYIAGFKYSDDAEVYCEAMQQADKIIGELTIRTGHARRLIELRFPQLHKAVVVDEPDHTAVELTAEVDTSKLALDDGGTLEWANIVLNNGEITSIDIAGKEYGVSINDIGDEPSDVADYIPEAQSCIEITSTHGRWIVRSITGTVRECKLSPGYPEGYDTITRFDLTEYREWRGMKAAELPQGGAIDLLLCGYWYTADHVLCFCEPSERARDDFIEQSTLHAMGPQPAPDPDYLPHGDSYPTP